MVPGRAGLAAQARQPRVDYGGMSPVTSPVLAEIREALLRSIVLEPDAVEEREPHWIAFFEAKWPRTVERATSA